MQRKKKQCISCGEERYIFSKGRCEFCAKKTYTKKKDVSLEKYFQNNIKIITKSEESGEKIHTPTKANVCHIFPKRIYKSIKDNELNVIHLTINEHTRFDYLMDSMDFEKLEKEFKNSWQKVCEKVKLLLPLIKENGKLKLKFEEYLNK